MKHRRLHSEILVYCRMHRFRLALLGQIFFGLVGAHAAEPRDLGVSDASPQVLTGVVNPSLGRLTTDPNQDKAAAVRKLLSGELDVAADPGSLFDIDVHSEAAIRVEAVRLRAMLRALGAAPVSAGSRGKPHAPVTPPAIADALTTMNGVEWKARLELDRARLDFYELPAARRQELLAMHTRRVAEAEAIRQKESDAQRRLRETAAEREQALDAAKRARSEAERLVAEEMARLLGIEGQLSRLERDFESATAAHSSRRDELLGWQRRARAARNGNADDADQTYDALRKALRSARDGLAESLDQSSSHATQIPSLGVDPLAGLKYDISADEVRSKRQSIERLTRVLRDREQQLRDTQAADLMDEIDTLNRERLDLLGSLSAQKRGEITGFSAAGLEQARAELRHLLLVLRYHRQVTTSWLRSVRKSGSLRGSAIQRTAVVLVPWTLVVMMFLWWRRNAPQILGAMESRVEQGDRAARLSRPSTLLQAIRYGIAIHVPLQRLILFFILTWLLPEGLRALLEVQLLIVIGGWVLAGALVVTAIDAAFTIETQVMADPQSAALRLRSLRLIGRVVVALGLTLVISDRLVGQGTIYRWVFSTYWIASVPIFLVLIRWWRSTVFTRIERVRRKSALQRWALANQTGWTSFFAATVAAVHLFVTGVARWLQNWLLRFGLVRRIHAYLFRRELDKLDAERTATSLSPLPAELFEALGPDNPSMRWIGVSLDSQVAKIVHRMKERSGGIFVVLGIRGAGKTAFLRHLHRQVTTAIQLSCAAQDGSAAIETQLANLTNLPAGASLDNCGQYIDDPSSTIAGVLIDDVQTQVQTAMGGLVAFDRLLAVAQHHCQRAVWILAIDEVIWPFLKRARELRPLCDEVIYLKPWMEDDIGRLLDDRMADAHLTATFADLLDELPANADETDRQDALQARKAGYYRLVWDYANGNPGIALHVWRTALALDDQGAVHVQRLQTPNGAVLDRLPDPAVFALRAILQLSRALPEDVARATRLRPTAVADTLRSALASGYLREENGRVQISWTWLRAITRFLERRHLLVLR